MRAEAHRLGQALLDHHRQVTRQMPPGKKIISARYTIRYGTLRTNGKLEVTHVNKPNWAQTFDSLTRAKRWIDAHPAAY